jgi:hypothetical protein
MKKNLIKIVALGTIFSATLAFAQPVIQQTNATTSKTAKAPKAAPAPPPTASDIASAKSKGLVWVNLNTKVYHASKDKEYGTTKNGKFMTEADAKAAGARAAKN